MAVARSGPDASALFDADSLWQAWLDVEAAMALAQADIGMIPQWAAQEIAARARLDELDKVELEREAAATKAPIVALVRVLAAACGEAGKFVHWGGTTQNIMSIGRLLLVRRTHYGTCTHMAGALDILGRLAEDHAGTIMAGRTNNRHALPITFGFKVAGWIEELARQNERFAAVESRVFALYFGGAIGAMHAYGDDGEALSEALARRLGFTRVLVPSRAALDSQAEYVTTLGLFAMAVGKVGGEVLRLMTEEINEVSERLGKAVVGSSTMPHKINPKHAVQLIALSAQLRAKVAPALEAGLTVFEGDAASNQLMGNTIETASALALDLARHYEETLASLIVNADTMARNLDASAGYIASENLMMVLAPRMGRSQAHDAVHHAVEHCLAGEGTVPEILMRQPEIAAMDTSLTDMENALSPASYLGNSTPVALRSAQIARDVAAALRARIAA